jgi:hypothetical protein
MPSLTLPVSTEQTCCGPELFIGTLAFLEGLAFTAVSIYALGAVLTVGPVGLIAAPIFLFTALVGINWVLVGIQEINVGLHPDEHVEIDYLPLVPDTWKR